MEQDFLVRVLNALQDYEILLNFEIENNKNEDAILEEYETQLLEVQELILTLENQK